MTEDKSTPPMVLLSLASKQIWPQVLAVLHARPQRLLLFHSEEEAESKRPAERLRDFFEAGAIANPPQVELKRAPHDRYKAVVDAFADAAEESQLDASNCRVNLTGGNKLMAMAAAEWCRLAGLPPFYLERDLRAFPFQPSGGDLLPQPDFKLDPHLARDIEPLALLRCQLDAADIVHAGQRLTLNEQGRRLPEQEIQPLLAQGHDFRKFLAWDHEEPDDRFGFDLEYVTAVALLKLGIPVVQRSIRFSPKTKQPLRTPAPPAEQSSPKTEPSRNPEIVLLTVTGMSPAVLTETVWALAHEAERVIPASLEAHLKRV